MKTALIAITHNGMELAVKAGYAMGADIFVKKTGHEYIYKYVINGDKVLLHPYATNLKKLVKKAFDFYEGLIFIMACGIVVRSIAPHLKGKDKDPAVVVVDEAGNFAISLLSGHMGGANRLALEVANATGGVPVITTATDINHVTAFDMFAKDNDCIIENMECLKKISAELVNGGKVCLYTDCRLSSSLPSNIEKFEGRKICSNAVALSNRTDIDIPAENVLKIRPKNLVLGIGCKKGKSSNEIETAVSDFLQENRKSILSVRLAASIDLKAREKGIIEFCREKGIEFETFSAEEIRIIEGRFETSEFVRKITGAGNVAEACAVLGGKKAKLICPRTVYAGITLALAEEERTYRI